MGRTPVTVIVPAGLADGYHLAGVRTEQTDTAAAAGAALDRLLAGHDRPSVIAVHQAYLEKQHAMLSVIMAAHQAMAAAVSHGAATATVTGAPVLGEVARMRAWPAGESARRAEALAREISESLSVLEGDGQWSAAGSLPSSIGR